MALNVEFKHTQEAIATIAAEDNGNKPTLILVYGNRSTGPTLLPSKTKFVHANRAVTLYREAVIRDKIFGSDTNLSRLKASTIVSECKRFGIEPRKPGKKRNRSKKDLITTLKTLHTHLKSRESSTYKDVQ